MDFRKLTDEAMKEAGHAQMRPVVEKELLHYEILKALNKGGLMQKLTFQGGTSLRLCYGSNRYSEDLDFAGGRGFVSTDMKDIHACVHDGVSKKYNLPVTITEPKNLRESPDYSQVNVNVWQIKIETAPERRDIKRQVIKLEIANVDARTREFVPLLKNYKVLPELDFELYPVQSMAEILCDKLVALVNSPHYVRYRDLWDITWLATARGVTYTPDLDPLIADKVNNYHIEDYGGLIETFLQDLNGHVRGKNFMDQMTRFLPGNVLAESFSKAGFLDYVEKIVGDQLKGTQKAYRHPDLPPPPFKM